MELAPLLLCKEAKVLRNGDCFRTLRTPDRNKLSLLELQLRRKLHTRTRLHHKFYAYVTTRPSIAPFGSLVPSVRHASRTITEVRRWQPNCDAQHHAQAIT